MLQMGVSTFIFSKSSEKIDCEQPIYFLPPAEASVQKAQRMIKDWSSRTTHHYLLIID